MTSWKPPVAPCGRAPSRRRSRRVMLFVVGVELELVAKAARSGRKRKRAAPLASLVASGMSQPLRRSCTLSPSVYHPLPSPPEGTPTTARGLRRQGLADRPDADGLQGRVERMQLVRRNRRRLTGGNPVREDHELVEAELVGVVGVARVRRRHGVAEHLDPMIAVPGGVDPAIPLLGGGQRRAVQCEPLDGAGIGVGIERASDRYPAGAALVGARREGHQQRARPGGQGHPVGARGRGLCRGPALRAGPDRQADDVAAPPVGDEQRTRCPGAAQLGAGAAGPGDDSPAVFEAAAAGCA